MVERTFHRLASVSAHFDSFFSTHTLPASCIVGHIYIAIGPRMPDEYAPSTSEVLLEAIPTLE